MEECGGQPVLAHRPGHIPTLLVLSSLPLLVTGDRLILIGPFGMDDATFPTLELWATYLSLHFLLESPRHPTLHVVFPQLLLPTGWPRVGQ